MSHRKIALRLSLVYGVLLVLSIAGNFIFSRQSGQTLPAATVSAIANSTLTHSILTNNFTPSIWQVLFVILMLQATGFLFNTTLLWQCRILFGDSVEKKIGFHDAGITTFWITMIVQLLLIIFFLYSVPATEVYEGRKILAAIALASGSFHLAGIPFYRSFFTGNMLELNFVVQLGIIGAVTLGSLGIFVLHELFSPRRLRQRLADPSIDWSFFAKVSVFVGGVAIVVSSMLYWMLEKEQLLAGKNITESAIATVYEVSALRGFGVSMFEERNSEPLASAISMVLAGPFSNGSGLTLLVFVALAFVSTYGRKSAVSGIAGRLMWKLMILTAISLTVAAFGVLSGAISFAQIVPAFTGNSVDINPDMGWGSVFWFSWLMLSGKLSLVVATFWLMWMVGNAKK